MSQPLMVTLWVVLALLGLGAIIAGGARLLRRRVVTGAGLSLSGAVVVALAVTLLAITSNLYTYRRLTAEQPVADLTFQQLGTQRYRVMLTEAAGPSRSLELTGDEWQLDARVIKWRGTATLLGLDPLYRLERLSGRYHDVARERDGVHSVYALAAHPGIDVWQLARRYQRWLPWVDTAYGSATYMPMADGARFAVTLSLSGLVARPVNAAAREAVSNWP